MRCQSPSRPWRFAITCAVAAGWLATAPAAYADTVNITTTGQIASSCTVAAASTFPAANLSANGSVAASASVSCNTGFVVKATSTNGAIKSATAAPTNFTNSLDYTLTLSLPLDSGATATATCAAALLKAGQTTCALSPAGTGLSSSGATAIGKTASLTAQWTVPALPTRLVAGSYSDTIVISIAAAP